MLRENKRALLYVRFPKNIFWDGELLESTLGNSCKRMREQSWAEGGVAMHWQKMPESILQEALDMRWPFRVFPNQNKEVGSLTLFQNLSFCDDWHQEGGKILRQLLLTKDYTWNWTQLCIIRSQHSQQLWERLHCPWMGMQVGYQRMPWNSNLCFSGLLGSYPKSTPI